MVPPGSEWLGGFSASDASVSQFPGVRLSKQIGDFLWGDGDCLSLIITFKGTWKNQKILSGYVRNIRSEKSPFLDFEILLHV